jgi:hypothetical protein
MFTIPQRSSSVHANRLDDTPEIPSEEWQSYCATVRSADPPSEPTLPAYDWLLGQAAYHRSRNDDYDPTGAHSLAADAINRLANSFAFHRSPSVSAYLADRWTPHHGLDLRLVRVPASWSYGGELASELAIIAALLISQYSDLATLAGKVILDIANAAEWLQSRNTEEFLLDEAAWLAAATDAVCNGVIG